MIATSNKLATDKFSSYCGGLRFAIFPKHRGTMGFEGGGGLFKAVIGVMGGEGW